MLALLEKFQSIEQRIIFVSLTDNPNASDDW